MKCQTYYNVKTSDQIDDSLEPHPATHSLEAWLITPRQRRLSFVGSLSRNNHQANNTTFEGTSLCQRDATATCESMWTWAVKKLWTIRTEKKHEMFPDKL